MALKGKEEKLLYKKAKVSSREVKKALKHNDYKQAFAVLSELESPIKSFFDNVEVNCENKNLRVNRLLILAKIKNLFNQLCNFSKINTI